MFGTLGGPELLLILVIALIVFGPRKLPEMGRSLGKMMLEFRRASNEFKRTVEDEVEAEQARERAPVAPPVAASALPAEPPASSSDAPAGTSPAGLAPLASPPGAVAVGETHDDPSRA